jgi:hypothetical protein
MLEPNYVDVYNTFKFFTYVNSFCSFNHQHEYVFSNLKINGVHLIKQKECSKLKK